MDTAPEDVTAAFERARRVRRSDDPALSDPTVRWAHRVLEARREIRASEPCPPAVTHRIARFFAVRPRGAGARLLDLVRDSGTLRLAVRGGAAKPRILRYAWEGTTVDVEVRTLASGRTLQVAVDPAVPGMTMEARPSPKGPRRVLPLDAAGCATWAVPAGARRLDAVFRVRGAPHVRLRGLPLD